MKRMIQYLIFALIAIGFNFCQPENITPIDIPVPELDSANVNNNLSGEYDTLRILTFNIFHGETTAGTIDMDMFAEIINSVNPDLVALQEVDVNCLRSGEIDEVAELASRTGMLGYFNKFRDYNGGEYGSAILSRLPVTDFSTWAHYTDTGEPRSFCQAKVKLPGDRFIYFNSSHLATVGEERAIEIQEIVDYYKNQLNYAPLLVCGDLNTEAQFDDMQPLLAEFKVSDIKLQNTFSTRSGMRKKIDFILLPKNDDWTVFGDVQVLYRADASDHCAVFAKVGYKR